MREGLPGIEARVDCDEAEAAVIAPVSQNALIAPDSVVSRHNLDPFRRGMRDLTAWVAGRSRSNMQRQKAMRLGHELSGTAVRDTFPMVLPLAAE
jgi:hypothetical protein